MIDGLLLGKNCVGKVVKRIILSLHKKITSSFNLHICNLKEQVNFNARASELVFSKQDLKSIQPIHIK